MMPEEMKPVPMDEDEKENLRIMGWVVLVMIAFTWLFSLVF